MDAIEKYDPERGCKFKTYAEFRIRGAIQDELRKQDWVPRSVREKSRKLERAYVETEQRLGRQAEDADVADSMGIDLEKFHKWLNQVRGISLLNLDEIRNVSGSKNPETFANLVEDTSSPNPVSLCRKEEIRDHLHQAIALLPKAERTVLTLYYFENLRMWEIGRIIDRDESRVCQIHAKAIRRLRGRLDHSVFAE